MKNVKVVLFPGAPVNVEVEGNESVREVFSKAGLDADGRELKIDGRAVDMSDTIGDANMLIAMKKIKGNAELKVVNFPGAPMTIEVNGSMTVRMAFDEAGIDCEGRELKLDGRQVELGDFVDGGRMLIAMKKIKGNASYEVGQKVRAIDGDTVAGCYGFDSPVEGVITYIDENTIAINDYFMDAEFIISNFELIVEDINDYLEKTIEEPTHQEEVIEEHVCNCGEIKKRAEEKLEELKFKRDNKNDIIKIYIEEVNKLQKQIDLLISILH